MKLLLDTHALIWWFEDSVRLGPEARAQVADRNNEIYVSVVSLWEITIKLRIGKLKASVREITETIEQSGFILLSVEPAHLVTLADLPSFHRDPFNHLLIAQAITEGTVLMSQDMIVQRYPVQTILCSP